MRSRTLIAALGLALATVGCGDDPVARSTAPEAREEPILVAALGDSITAGSPLWDPDPRIRRQIGPAVDRRSQFEHWAERRLGDAASFRNCGVFGERTDEIAERLDDCARGAGALIVQGGINDIVQGRAVEDAAANLEAMVERGKRLGVATTLVEVLPWDNGFPEADSEIRALNGLIAEIGRRQYVTVLPFYEALEDPANPAASARG